MQPRTETIRVLMRREARARREGTGQDAVNDYWRPTTRADCSKFGRPCPYVGCRYNISVHVRRNGGIEYVQDIFALIDAKPKASNCALDIADDGSHTCLWIAEQMGVVKERVRQIEMEALAKLGRKPKGDTCK